MDFDFRCWQDIVCDSNAARELHIEGNKQLLIFEWWRQYWTTCLNCVGKDGEKIVTRRVDGSLIREEDEITDYARIITALHRQRGQWSEILCEEGFSIGEEED